MIRLAPRAVRQIEDTDLLVVVATSARAVSALVMPGLKAAEAYRILEVCARVRSGRTRS